MGEYEQVVRQTKLSNTADNFIEKFKFKSKMPVAKGGARLAKSLVQSNAKAKQKNKEASMKTEKE